MFALFRSSRTLFVAVVAILVLAAGGLFLSSQAKARKGGFADQEPARINSAPTMAAAMAAACFGVTDSPRNRYPPSAPKAVEVSLSPETRPSGLVREAMSTSR